MSREISIIVNLTILDIPLQVAVWRIWIFSSSTSSEKSILWLIICTFRRRINYPINTIGRFCKRVSCPLGWLKGNLKFGKLIKIKLGAISPTRGQHSISALLTNLTIIIVYILINIFNLDCSFFAWKATIGKKLSSWGNKSYKKLTHNLIDLVLLIIFALSIFLSSIFCPKMVKIIMQVSMP